MVLLKNILDVELLVQHIQDGLVTRRYHDSLPLAILNYTPECQFSRAWDDVTRKCRGLIYNYETMEVVARPFEKFFNWDESGAPYPPSGPVLRMPKMDGSLGILYWNGNGYAVSTRGSMHSEQAEWATEFYNDAVGAMEHEVNRWLWDDEGWANGVPEGPKHFVPLIDKTYLFEIIYPENRIVVDYGEYKGLVLIDVIDNETGYPDTDEFDNCEWPDKVVRVPMAGFDSGQCQDIPDGDEGFVYLWPTRNFRTKMKAAQYVILHRLISNLNEKTVWEQLVAGKTLDEIKKDLPEEFHGFIERVGGDIQYAAASIIGKTAEEMFALKHVFPNYASPQDVPRAEFAKAIKESPYRKYLFLMLDKKDIYPVALKDSKPVKASKTAMEKEAA